MPRQTQYLAVKYGARLRELRMEQGMTLDELAEASGLSLRHLSCLENGQIMMGLTVLAALSTALRLPLVCFVIFPDEDERDRFVDMLRKMSPDQLREFQEKIRPLLQERSERNGAPSTAIKDRDRDE
nr:helix-turn-helix domain-containing protein [Polyangium aurulentum]